MSASAPYGSRGRVGYGGAAAELEGEWAPFDLSPKVRAALVRAGWTVADVAHAPDVVLLGIRAFGVKALAEVRPHVPYVGPPPPAVPQPYLDALLRIATALESIDKRLAEAARRR